MIRDQVYTLTEAAQVIGVNRLTIRMWLKRGLLTAERLGGVALIPRDDVHRLKAKRAETGRLRLDELSGRGTSAT